MRCNRAPFPPLTRRSALQLCAAPLLALATGETQAAEHAAKFDPFLIYYGDQSDPAIGQYALAVLDSDIDKAALEFKKPLYLGYLSLGEVATYRPYYGKVAGEGLLISANPNWPDAHFVDMRAAGWHRRVIEDLIPPILSYGFKGLFFDTLDDAEYLQSEDPKRFAGMVDGAARLILTIRKHFPKIPLMINRGYAALPKIAGRFDMLLGEGVRSNYTGDGHFALTSQSDYQWQRGQMLAARKRDPKLFLFSLDYWDPQDKRGIARLYAQERANGFIPYVSTPSLTKIIAEP